MGIISIAYGNKSDTECRKNIIDVLPDLDIVPAEPRKVFDDDGIDYARFGVVQQSLYFGTLKGRTGHAVVYVFAVNFKAVFLGILA